MGNDNSLKKKCGHRKVLLFFKNEKRLEHICWQDSKMQQKEQGCQDQRDLNLNSGPVTVCVDKSLNLCTSTYTCINDNANTRTSWDDYSTWQTEDIQQMVPVIIPVCGSLDSGVLIPPTQSVLQSRFPVPLDVYHVMVKKQDPYFSWVCHPLCYSTFFVNVCMSS